MDKTLIVLCALLLGSLGVPAYSNDLPDLKPEVTITNTFPEKTVTPVVASPEMQMVAAKTKDDLLKAAHERDKKLNDEYKALKNKPNMFRHPVKRSDLWIDYHQNTYRKFRTRVLPAVQFCGVMVGMGFSIASAL